MTLDGNWLYFHYFLGFSHPDVRGRFPHGGVLVFSVSSSQLGSSASWALVPSPLSALKDTCVTCVHNDTKVGTSNQYTAVRWGGAWRSHSTWAHGFLSGLSCFFLTGTAMPTTHILWLAFTCWQQWIPFSFSIVEVACLKVNGYSLYPV